MEKSKKIKLILENGAEFEGQSFGYEQSTAGEIVFNTAMVGYPESLTDPSYAGQILIITFPLVGNYGVPEDTKENSLSTFYESEIIHTKGLIISDYSFEYSHWNANKSLSEWLVEHKIPAVFGIDTRELTKIIRETGAMKAKIEFPDEPIDFADYTGINWVAETSCKEVIRYGTGKYKVVLVDCGTKHNIVRSLVRRGVEVIRVPWDYDFNTLDFDGLFISNGPGDPALCGATVDNIRKTIARGDKPICGICMGNQLLSIAAGAKTYKLKYGHRSHNQPVQMLGSDRCFITSQNHGYAVDSTTLPADWEPLFVNLNDNTNEGIRHKTKPYFSAQFHPEAASGPTDTQFIFDLFIEGLGK